MIVVNRTLLRQPLQDRAMDDDLRRGVPRSGRDWLVLHGTGDSRLAFQQVERLLAVTWPDGPIQQMLHLDLTVPTTAELDRRHDRALACGAILLLDRSDDPDEPLRVYRDPDGHPFRLFVAHPPDDRPAC